jgi:hypothetical protein
MPSTSKEADEMNAPTHEPLSTAEKLEEDAEIGSAAVVGGLRAVEVAAVVLLGLLVCPPLAILAFLVVVPVLGLGLVLGLLAAILSTPYLLVHHFRARDRGHGSLFVHRLRRAGRALHDLLPHRLVADARQGGRGR